MFETLDSPLDRTVSRRSALLAYGIYVVVSLLLLILDWRMYGFSQPFQLAVPAAILLLSWTLLVTTLGSEVPLTIRKVRVFHIIILLLVFADQRIETMFPRIDADPNEILRAAYGGDLEKTRRLLKHNPSRVFVKDKEGFTALHYAASHGHVEIAKLLLANGADVNAMTDKAATPLQYAVWYGGKETVQLLLSNKADTEVQGEIGGTPLYDAAAHGQIEEVGMLLAAKADVNARTLQGYTALSVAASNGHEDVVRLLIDNGASVNAANLNGCTALYWARTKGHKRIADLLRQHGALEPCANPASSR